VYLPLGGLQLRPIRQENNLVPIDDVRLNVVQINQPLDLINPDAVMVG
jgi:hypothetical protein